MFGLDLMIHKKEKGLMSDKVPWMLEQKIFPLAESLT